jgi:hypothetical protein
MRKMILTPPLLALGTLSFLSGCSTQVQVSPLEQNLAANQVVNGLPFRSRERYQVTLYRFDGTTYQPVETKEQTASLANLDVLYVLRVKGAALSDGTVTVKMRTDNTLESVNVKSTSKGQEVLTALGKGMKDLADAEAARDKVAETDVVGGEDKQLAALEAKQAADLAVVELSELAATATQAQRTAAEQKVVKLKLVANQKARRAGLTQLPFSDAGG